jgi:hypothetical protein
MEQTRDIIAQMTFFIPLSCLGLKVSKKSTVLHNNEVVKLNVLKERSCTSRSQSAAMKFRKG